MGTTTSQNNKPHSKDDSKESESNRSSGRWWEFYFVRYLVGTIIGAVIIFYLNTNCESKLYQVIIPKVTDISQVDLQKLSLLGALGFAYCYVSSAPILVFHATRGLFLYSIKTGKTSNGAIVNAIMTILFALIYFQIFESDIRYFFAIFIVIYVVLFQLALLFFAGQSEGKKIHEYYKKLTKARSDQRTEAREYQETYKHLREHGNAFFIVF